MNTQCKVETTVDASLDLTINKFSGKARYKDIDAVIERFYNGKVTKHAIYDYTDADVELTSHEIKKLAVKSSSYGRVRTGGVTGMVVRQKLAFGLSHIYLSHAEASRTRQKNHIFGKLEDAVEFIRREAEKQPKKQEVPGKNT